MGMRLVNAAEVTPGSASTAAIARRWKSWLRSPT